MLVPELIRVLQNQGYSKTNGAYNDQALANSESPNKGQREDGLGSPDGAQDTQQFQEMDLNVYEDDDDETLHRKLIAAKIARKRAEEDMKLLSNRISLLK